MNVILKECLQLMSENLLSFIKTVNTGNNLTVERTNKTFDKYSNHFTFNGKSILLLGEGKLTTITNRLSTPNNIILSMDLFRKPNTYICINNLLLTIPLTGNIEKLPKDYFESFDYILSNAVLEHLVNPKKSLNKMYHALKVNGSMLHYVDIGPHNLFNNDWKVINRFPKFIWKLLTFRNGKINRLQYNDYVKLFNRYSWSKIEIKVLRENIIMIKAVK